MERQIVASLEEALKRKMTFLSGPRQVGKTTIARQALSRIKEGDSGYLNWDRPEHRKIILDYGWTRSLPWVVLDEVHKYSRWKSHLKGFYDTEGDRQKILVTGSARLDSYKKGGDSLLGRYFGYRLHPLSIGELARQGKPPEEAALHDPNRWLEFSSENIAPEALDRLWENGGFPEPYLENNSKLVGQWRLARQELILKEEMRELTQIRNIGLVERLLDLLRERVGSPLSIQSLCEILQIHHATAMTWIEALERLYLVFRVPPYSGSLARTLRKEGKIYFWDWADTQSLGARFENMVACHLLKLCHWLHDVEGVKAELRMVRDLEKREVDFLVLREQKPWFLVEAKSKPDTHYGPLQYFKKRLAVPFAFQVVQQGGLLRDIIPAARFFRHLP